MAEVLEPEVKKEAPAEDLQTRLKKATQFKAPGQNNTSNFTPPEEKKTTGTNNAAGSEKKTTRENIKWNSSSSDFDDEPDDDPEDEPNAPTKNQDDKKFRKIPFNDRTKLASARIWTNSFNQAQRIGFTLWQTKRFKKKLTDDIKEVTVKYEGVDRETIAEQKHKKICLDFDKMLDRHTQKLADIPMTETEQKDMTTMFVDYQDYTQELLSPAWGIGLSISNIFISRITDTLTD